MVDQVQDSWPRRRGIGYAGQRANLGEEFVALQKMVKTAAVPFGRLVKLDSADDNAVVLGVDIDASSFEVTNCIGIAEEDRQISTFGLASTARNQLPVGWHASIGITGIWFMETTVAVSAFSDLVVLGTSGRCESTTANATNGTVPGAFWLNDVAANNIGPVYFKTFRPRAS